ncbi:MAG: prepilin-type N-terminal cleavage/methylation domain-containing protein [Chthoniobacter sp.]
MSGRSNLNARRAFTLLEMIIALMITSMIVLSLFRFVTAHLTTIRVSTESGEERDNHGRGGALPAGADEHAAGDRGQHVE